jgi:hypothetical protein
MIRRRAVLRLGATVGLALLATAAMAGTASAECMFIPPFPRAEPAIRSAEEVIVGDIVGATADDLDVGPNQGPRTMALRVSEVLRGPRAVGDLVDIEYLEPNWPWIKYRGGTGEAVPSCTYLLMEADIGDTIALALGAVQPAQRLERQDISWTQPRTTYNGMSKIHDDGDLAEIRRIAGLPETDTAGGGVANARPAAPAWLLVVVLGAIAGGLSWRRTHHRADPSVSQSPIDVDRPHRR